jgi:hypothetical protein
MSVVGKEDVIAVANEFDTRRALAMLPDCVQMGVIAKKN